MKRLSHFLALAILVSTVGFGCSDPKKLTTRKEISKPAFDLANAKKQIEATNQTYMELAAKGDSAGVASLYTKDARLFFAGMPVVVGRANIKTAFSRILQSGVTKLDITTIEVFGTEDLLAEEGSVIIYVKDKAVAEEKSIILWKKEEGTWKLFRDIANSNSK
jgi:uncharacterized protein (TIGR02246 family)